MSDARPVVIGAGVMGCSIAHALARRGLRPIVVDRGPAAGAGSTSSSSAIVRFNYSTLDAVRLSWEAKFHWDNWAEVLGVVDELGMVRLINTGILVLDSPSTPLSAVRGPFDEIGIPYEAMTAEQIAHRFPDLDLGHYGPPKRVDDPDFWSDASGPDLGGYFMPDAGFVDDPALAAHNLMVAAAAGGAEFRFRTEVTGLVIDGGRVVALDTRRAGETAATVPASFVVNAAGPHSSAINRMAGLPPTGIQTRPMRQEVHVVPSARGFSLDSGAPILTDVDLGTYSRPHLGGTTLVGSVEPDCDPLEWIDDADHYNESTTVEGWEANTTRLARRISTVGVPPSPAGLAALYDVSDDWLPIYDRTDVDGLYVAIGTSGNQFKNAPMVGVLIAELAAACESGHDHDTDPVVVTGPFTGQPINLGAFSRRRERLSTTNSVLG